MKFGVKKSYKAGQSQWARTNLGEGDERRKGKRKEGRRKSFKVTVGKGNGKPD